MKINEITQLAGRHKRRKRIGRGRGSGSGKTSGRGTKGAGSRSGWSSRGLAEGGAIPFFRTIPKRGFSNFHFTKRFEVVNLCDLEERFAPGTHVTLALLAEAGLIRNDRCQVKILGTGSVTKKLVIEAHGFSKSAQDKITAVGGQAKVI